MSSVRSSEPTPMMSERATIGDGPGGRRWTSSPGIDVAEEALPGRRDQAARAGWPSPRHSGSSSATGASSQPGADRQLRREVRRIDRVGCREAGLGPAGRRLEVDEDRTALERDEMDLGAGLAEQRELGAVGASASTPTSDGGRHAEPGDGEPAVHDAAAQSPAARIGRVDVAGGRADHDDGRPEGCVGHADLYLAVARAGTPGPIPDRRTAGSERVLLRTA